MAILLQLLTLTTKLEKIWQTKCLLLNLSFIFLQSTVVFVSQVSPPTLCKATGIVSMTSSTGKGCDHCPRTLHRHYVSKRRLQPNPASPKPHVTNANVPRTLARPTLLRYITLNNDASPQNEAVQPPDTQSKMYDKKCLH